MSRLGCALATLLLASCTLPTRAPLAILSDPSPLGEEAGERSLVVFLRGRGNDHLSFASEGFIEAIRQSKLHFDVIAPNSHMGYYMARSIVDRLKADVMDPARARGYDHIYLVGVSLGGIGALLYADAYPEDVDGIYLIAPFLGDRPILSEVASAGGLALWQPPVEPNTDDWQAQLWTLLKQHEQQDFSRPPVFLGYGRDDRYHEGHQLLADAMPATQVITIEGAHRLSTFAAIWQTFLDSEHIPLR